MKKTKTYIIAGKAIIVACLFFFFCSCISFDIGDWPSSYFYPHNSPIANLCGPIGAFFAYYLLYYLGPGVFVILLTVIGFLIAQLAGVKIGQPALRSIGLLLLTVAVSASFYCFWPHKVFTFPNGSGGLLGVGVILFLRSHFAVLGTFILIAATWAVGIVLLADTFAVSLLKYIVLGLHKVFGFVVPVWAVAKKQLQVINEIWRKLSAKQKPLTGTAVLSNFGKDKKLENRIKAVKYPVAAKKAPKKEARDESKNASAKSTAGTNYGDYILPPLELLAEPEYGFSAVQDKVVKSKAAALEKLLDEFNIIAHVVAAETGPVVTMFELELSAGVKVSQISSLANDIARALGAGAIRVVAPLPGKHTIGIEVPNSEKEKVRMKDLINLAGSKPGRMQIPMFLGKDSSGEALVSDLTSMPHLLIAGTTGSGKSVCINSVITSILLTKRPDEVKMILIDPKMVEMTAFNLVPHLMCPIVTETKRAVQILEWATVKMDERYSLLAEARVRNIAEYNQLGTEEIIERFNPTTEDEQAKIPKRLAYIMIVIDELADLMMTAAKEIEAYIVRLAQKSRAVGIHIILATQRPQATVVTGLIKSNMPTRIGFRVAARMDSRIILDQNGAETLLGQGDMLFLKPGTSDLVRAQGTLVDDVEIHKIVKHLKTVAEPQYHPELTQLGRLDPSEMSKDELFDDAVRIVVASHRGSVSLLQRRLSIGYARASRIIELMAASGILGEYKGSQAREVLMTLKEYENVCAQMEADDKAGYKDLADEEEEIEEPVYLNEGQQEYVAIDNEQE